MRITRSRTRRLLAVLAILCIALTFATGPTSATPPTVTDAEPAINAPRPPAEQGEVRTQTGGSCQNLGINNFHTGMTNTSSSTSRKGVAADIKINPSGFSICSATPLDFDDNGPAAYISMEPRAGSPSGCQEWTSCIIQIGIEECAGFGIPSCDGNGNPSFFWAAGGCSGYDPIAQDLGPADYNWHHYEIYQTQISGVLQWKGTIDGAMKFHFPVDTWYKTECWDTGNLGAEWAGERWDTGDSLGNSTSGQKLDFQTARWTPGTGWNTPNFTSGTGVPPCAYEMSDDVCELWGGDNMYIYSN